MWNKVVTALIVSFAVTKPLLDNISTYLDSTLPPCLNMTHSAFICENASIVWWWYMFRLYFVPVVLALTVAIVPLPSVLARYCSIVIALDCINDLLWYLINGDQKNPMPGLVIYLVFIIYGLTSFEYWANRMSKGVEPNIAMIYLIIKPPKTLLGTLVKSVINRQRIYWSNGRAYRVIGKKVRVTKRAIASDEILINCDPPSAVIVAKMMRRN